MMPVVKQEGLEREWKRIERNLGFYYSKVLKRPLCPPEHVYFSLTNRCNLRCKMCGIPSANARAEEELSTEQCKKIIDQIAGLKVDHIIFSGGEPILRKDIFSLIEHAASKKIGQIDLISNGLLIDEETARRLTQSGLSHITLSIDGLETANDFIRGRGSFQKALTTIDIFRKIRGERARPTVGINFTIMDCNLDDMLPMIDLARSKGCNIIVFQPMMSDNTEMQERKKNDLWVSVRNMDKLREVIRKILLLKKAAIDEFIHVDERILELIPDYFEGTSFNEDLQCYEAIVRIVLTFDGDLWTCQGLIGNLKESSLRKEWLSQKAKAIRCKVDHCRTHCLQSCVHLFELSDIHAGAVRFVATIADGNQKRKYVGRLIKTLNHYKDLLRREKLTVFLREFLKKDQQVSAHSLNSEMQKVIEHLEALKSRKT